MMKRNRVITLAMIAVLIVTSFVWRSGTASAEPPQQKTSYPIVDTNQSICYDNYGSEITCNALPGQDASYQGLQPDYYDNGDGTITDLNTGLMWQQTPGDKASWDDAIANAGMLSLAGYDDWRVPTLKELYSLMDFSGWTGMDAASSRPYLDTAYFDFEYGDTSAGERMIDAQYWSSTVYGSTTMNGAQTAFGVNFADGRIKGYPIASNRPGAVGTGHFVRYVRGDTAYGINSFVGNSDGTISDNATGLQWMRNDSGAFNAGPLGSGALNWEEALDFCESLDFAGASDWRLPNAKELQSIVDYTRSPDTTGSAAIDPIFTVTQITNEIGQVDYPYFWTSTTHVEGPSGDNGVYVAFGRASGYMSGGNSGSNVFMDVHGAGAQRSDPKIGNALDYAGGRGPQGDIVRIDNYARCVRDGYTQSVNGDVPSNTNTGQPPVGVSVLAAAAATLGITEQQLQSALGPPPPNFAAAATTLGITADALIAALGLPADGPPQAD